MEQDPETYVKNLMKDFLTTYMSHFSFDKAIENFPEDRINDVPENAPFNFWELLEHIRRMFQEIMDYVVKDDYEYISSDYKYWPKKLDEPVTLEKWRHSISEITRLYKEIVNIIEDPSEKILGELKFQAGSGHTLLRQVMMIIDHNSYHMAQFILMRKLLGIWG